MSLVRAKVVERRKKTEITTVASMADPVLDCGGSKIITPMY